MGRVWEKNENKNVHRQQREWAFERIKTDRISADVLYGKFSTEMNGLLFSSETFVYGYLSLFVLKKKKKED